MSFYHIKVLKKTKNKSGMCHIPLLFVMTLLPEIKSAFSNNILQFLILFIVDINQR